MSVPAAPERGYLVLADISGYTDYVVASPLEFAEDVVSDVTATVVRHLEPVLRVNKIEGDAAFCFAPEDEVDASMLLDAIEECYFAFRRRLRGIEHSTSCTCNACAKAPDLNLKFVVHHGEYVRRAGPRSGEELTGRDVILVHTLLKNDVPTALGLRGYALYTDAAVAALEVDPEAIRLRRHATAGVAAWVADLQSRWDEELERHRVVVEPEEASFAVEALLPVAPAVAWEYLTATQRRLLWQVDAIEQADAGGRRLTGTASVCVDGRSKIYEEILDWRPFDYFSERVSLPGGVRVVQTTALESDAGGTRVVTRGRSESGGRLRSASATRSLRRKLEGQYDRLARLLPSQIPEERRLPLAAG